MTEIKGTTSCLKKILTVQEKDKLEALKSLCRSPWSMCILTINTDKFMTKLSFGDGDLSIMNLAQ